MAELVKKLDLGDAKRALQEKIEDKKQITAQDLHEALGKTETTPQSQDTPVESAPDTSGEDDKPEVKSDPIPEEDVMAFQEAVLYDGRFMKTYTMMDGKFSVTFRSRTVKEGNAVMAATRAINGAERISDIEMRNIMDAALLALQVVSCGGVDYSEVPQDALLKTVGADGEVTQPEWYGRIKTWLETSEAKLSLVLSAYRKFELLYQRLCKESSIENF